ncbi:tyrosine-protein phosphatase [Actinacidiphila sp. bgisy160]|uniref:tyrosine-protein phosphatase n=1 Tax=Actinacidiphila sp. bgisy160 TaxID=3413796 RepID=UPI003D75178F
MATGTAIHAGTVINLRDLGGIPLAGPGAGHAVRSGTVLRSGRLDRYDPATDPRVADLGIRTVVDLRTAGERGAAPDVLPAGARLFVADVFGDDPHMAPARLRTLLRDPARAGRELGGGRAEDLMAEAYRRMVTSPTACSAYRALLETAADPAARPVLFHCTAGKDRTGWASTLLLTLLGADPAVVRGEFLAVNAAVQAAYSTHLRRFMKSGGDPGIAAAVLEVRERYLDAALGAVAEGWGDMTAYARHGLRLPDPAVARLREGLIEFVGDGGSVTRSSHTP